MQNIDFDVIVIGSGVAACAAGLACEKFGLSVLMLTPQKQYQEVDEFCPSESIHGGIMSLLEYIGAGDVVSQSCVGEYQKIKIGSLESNVETENTLEEKGYHINKSSFYQAFIDIASERNITLWFEESVSDFVTLKDWIIGVQTQSGKRVIGKYIIDGSGKASIAGKNLGLVKQFYSPPLLVWSGKISEISQQPIANSQQPIAYFIPQKDTWHWIAFEFNNSLSYTCLAKKGKPFIAVPDVLNDIGTEHPIKRCNMRWWCYEKLTAKGVIICGDAGANVDPAAGQGILFALYSGIKAAEAVQKCLNLPEGEEEYLVDYSRWFKEVFLGKVEKLKGLYKEWGIEVM